MKVHITLVGRQPSPVYHGIVYSNPDKIVYIYSDQTAELAMRLSEEVHVAYERRKFDPVDLAEIEKKTLRCAESFANDDVSVNISGGTKPWSYYFALVFGARENAKVFYVDQNNVVWNLSNKQSEMVSFDMDAQFRLFGNPLTHYQNFSSFDASDERALRIIEKARRFCQKQFTPLAATLKKEWEQCLKNCESGSFVQSDDVFAEWHKPNFVRLCLTKKSADRQEFLIESTNAVRLTFNSGWFEYKVASLLSQWDKCKEIRMNCIFPPISETDNSRVKHPKNEIDVIVNTGTKLLFVECKTSISSSNDIDKFRNAVRNYGGQGSKALFVTEHSMTDMQMEKCIESNVITFSLCDSVGNRNNLSGLYEKLNEELYNINA